MLKTDGNWVCAMGDGEDAGEFTAMANSKAAIDNFT